MILFSFQEMNAQEKKTKNSLAEAQERIKSKMNKESKSVRETKPSIDVSFKKGEAIGILKIPRLEAELPIIEGTDEDELEKGVGHFSTTVFPGQPDQILLSGHRDTVFRSLGELESGDLFQVSMPYGEYTYEITDSEIVDADDTTVIRSTSPHEILTVSTCYPFSYVGNAPYRYILNAKRIEQ
ncbi:class D sortase [Bacillus sp. J33]|uniref:class D sortase n=1 Tax=Bacillus sp. J33 TaxID=935836 RepID=UPI001E643FAA|nr:class D sortase [Bacillus sp. J33]